MAATLKVIRGGCSSASSMLIPAICCSGLQEGAVGSSMASPAAGTSRLMHMGQWHNSLPQQKALPFGRCGVLSQGVKMEQLINYRTTCNLPRMSDGVKGLRQKYMRVPRYEVYGSEFSILYLWNQINGVGKVINGYKQNWSYPVGIVFVVACIGACAIDGYTNNKRNVKMLAGIKSNTKKAAGTVKETAQILQEIEEAICKEEEGKQ